MPYLGELDRFWGSFQRQVFNRREGGFNRYTRVVPRADLDQPRQFRNSHQAIAQQLEAPCPSDGPKFSVGMLLVVGGIAFLLVNRRR